MTIPQSVYEPEVVADRPARDERVQTLSVFHMDATPDGQGRMFLPDLGVIYYRRDNGQKWQVRVKLSGPRVLSTGVVSSRSRADRTYFLPEDAEGYVSRAEIPAFLLPTVEQFRPEW